MQTLEEGVSGERSSPIRARATPFVEHLERIIASSCCYCRRPPIPGRSMEVLPLRVLVVAVSVPPACQGALGVPLCPGVSGWCRYSHSTWRTQPIPSAQRWLTDPDTPRMTAPQTQHTAGAYWRIRVQLICLPHKLRADVILLRTQDSVVQGKGDHQILGCWSCRILGPGTGDDQPVVRQYPKQWYGRPHPKRHCCARVEVSSNHSNGRSVQDEHYDNWH